MAAAIWNPGTISQQPAQQAAPKASCCWQWKRKPDQNSWSGGPVCGETNPARLYRIKRSSGADKIVCDRDLAAALGLWDWAEVVRYQTGGKP